DTLLMASIFDRANKLHFQGSAARLLEHFDWLTDYTCRAMEILRLVEPTRSTLGYKPTQRLVDIILDRIARPNTDDNNNPVAMMDRDYFEFLWQVATDGAT